MTDRFLKAMPYVFLHEGGFNSIKGDSGGATNWGVSLRFLKTLGAKGDIDHDGDVDWLDIQKMTKEEAEQIYFDNFWKPLYEKFTEKLSIKIFDTAVNMGLSGSNKVLQRALNALGPNIVVDGIVGPGTFIEVAKYQEVNLLKSFCLRQKEYYDNIITKDPTQAKFKTGWENRAAWLPQ
jgi:lysozyme family protein